MNKEYKLTIAKLKKENELSMLLSHYNYIHQFPKAPIINNKCSHAVRTLRDVPINVMFKRGKPYYDYGIIEYNFMIAKICINSTYLYTFNNEKFEDHDYDKTNLNINEIYNIDSWSKCMKKGRFSKRFEQNLYNIHPRLNPQNKSFPILYESGPYEKISSKPEHYLNL